MENPIKMHDLGVPLFSETSKCLQGDNWGGLLLITYNWNISQMTSK